MPRINLFEHWSDEGHADSGEALQLVRPEANEVAVIPFTTDMALVKLHYSDLKEIPGWIQCNGDPCVLCQAGRKVEERVLLPVYLPASKAIGVLPISPSSRPGSLRPPVMAALRSEQKVALIISKPDRMSFRVQAVDLKPHMDDGAKVVKAFLKRWEADQIDLTAVYAKVDNADLAELPSLAAILQFKGLLAPAGEAEEEAP